MNKEVKENLYLNPGVPYDANPLLHHLRLKNAAYFWLELEKKEPGYIRRFHEAYYKFLNDGGRKEDLQQLTILEKILKDAELWAAFHEAAQVFPIAHLGEEASKEPGKPKIYIWYSHLKNGNKKQLTIFVAKKTTQGTPESIWGRLDVNFKLVNLRTGKVSILLNSHANEKRQVVIDLEDPNNGQNLIKPTVGISDRYKIIIDTQIPEENLHEEFEFEYL